MQVLDTVAWERDGRLSQRHLIGYTGLPPDYAGMRTACGKAVPSGRALAPAQAAAADVASCSRCQERLGQRGHDFYKRQQRRFTAIDRRRRAAEQHEEHEEPT
jgi:hypothetical protein